MNYLDITYPDVNNGIGLRVTLWLSGCNHQCKGCQNPQTWNPNAGKKFTSKDKEKLFLILQKDYITGITFSGGDPLYDGNVAELLDLVREIRHTFKDSKTIWLYTGYIYEQIFFEQDKINIRRQRIIEMCDVVVDGEFIQNLRDVTLPFRGSRNQRVIDVQKSITMGNVHSLL